MASQLAGFVFTLLLAYTSANNNTGGTEDVDFLVGMDTGVILYNSRDNSTYVTMNTSDWVYYLDYHYSKHLIFAYSERKLFKATIEPQCRRGATTPTAKMVKHGSQCTAFAVDWVHDRISWAKCDSNRNSIMSCGLDGKAEQTVLSEAFGEVVGMEIDPYMGILFWVATGTIHSIETSGEGCPLNVTTNVVQKRAFTLDLTMRRVYYVGEGDISLYSIDYTGGQQVKHFSCLQFFSVLGLSILGDKVFWLTKFTSDRLEGIHEGVYEAPLNLTRTEDVKLVKELFHRYMWHMRVMHPSLQSQPRIDPCLAKGCAHSCVASGTTTAVCECPPGQALNNDGISCHAKNLLEHYGCTGHDQCPNSKACIQGKCDDPCEGVCGDNTSCTVHLHVPACVCKDGYTGNAIRGCHIQESSETCPATSHGKKKYYLVHLEIDWPGALLSCLRNSSRLASVESKEDYDVIMDEINKTAAPGRSEHYWTAGTDYGREGDFVWATTGTRLSSASDLWTQIPFQPKNRQNNQHCVKLEKTPNRLGYGLNVWECSHPFNYICEFYS